MTTSIKIIQVNTADDVAVALMNLPEGEVFEHFTTRSVIPKGHKIALRNIRKGEHVTKYGHSIGIATCNITLGEHIHSHNLRTALNSNNTYSYHPYTSQEGKNITSGLRNNFMGYKRRNGKVGTRNEIWVLNTVGCVNKISENIARRGNNKIKNNPEFRNIDGVYSFSHPYGCSQLGDDLNLTRNILLCLALHPNAGAVLIIGLGCENNQLNKLLEGIESIDRNRIRSFNAQMVEDEDEAGDLALEELLNIIKTDQRTKCDASHLSLGMKCGGSDAFSGLTANPLVGEISNIVTAFGGRSSLTEVPEMLGAEQMLMNRSENVEIYENIIKLINDFKEYFNSYYQPIYENPSPGNIQGGITTLEEKSLGAIQKGGNAIITKVLPYGESTTIGGLTLISGPGNDAVSSTALTASGATLLLFTTGRGTPLGFPAPTIKISTNSDLKLRKPNWIDFDAGQLLQEKTSIEKMTVTLWNLIIDTASGKKTHNEINECREISIWKKGVTL